MLRAAGAARIYVPASHRPQCSQRTGSTTISSRRSAQSTSRAPGWQSEHRRSATWSRPRPACTARTSSRTFVPDSLRPGPSGTCSAISEHLRSALPSPSLHWPRPRAKRRSLRRRLQPDPTAIRCPARSSPGPTRSCARWWLIWIATAQPAHRRRVGRRSTAPTTVPTSRTTVGSSTDGSASPARGRHDPRSELPSARRLRRDIASAGWGPLGVPAVPGGGTRHRRA